MERKRGAAEVNLLVIKKAERDKVEEGLSEKRQTFEELAAKSPKTYQETRLLSDAIEQTLFEIGEMEAKLLQLDAEILELEGGEGSEKRQAIIAQAEALATEKQDLLKRIEEIDERGQALREEFEKAVPMKRIQVESAKFIRWEREREVDAIVGSTFRGQPISEKQRQREETETDALPERVRAMQEGGWVLCEGQKIEPEKLTPMNSRETPTVPTPDVFGNFF